MSEPDEGNKAANFVALGVGVLILFGVLGGAVWLLSGGAGGRPTGEVTSDERPATEQDCSPFFSVSSRPNDFAREETLVVTYAAGTQPELADVEVAVTIHRRHDIILGEAGPQAERWGSLRPGETRVVKTQWDQLNPVARVSLAGTGTRGGRPIRFTAEMPVR